ncbi:MAG: translation initiation factor [Candidatus Nephrothrix sp. EaCA]|nr:MAG: translation initiation factor [Candidatus Nephrothrix sp. EaCA]
MSKNNDWKKREGVVFSTDKEFRFEYGERQAASALPPSKQSLTILLDKHLRAGKQVTLIRGFVGGSEELEKLGKTLKTKCGVGGSTKDGEIILQGDHRNKAAEYLTKDGFRIKKI